jgi:hypothetical protein
MGPQKYSDLSTKRCGKHRKESGRKMEHSE